MPPFDAVRDALVPPNPNPIVVPFQVPVDIVPTVARLLRPVVAVVTKVPLVGSVIAVAPVAVSAIV
jgi:hypothetical protein